jgi:NADPH:quinone reductase
VAKVGANVTEYKVGDRVCGGAMSGAYAEYIACIPQSLFHLPDNVSFEQGAAFHSTYATSYGALKVRAALKQGAPVPSSRAADTAHAGMHMGRGDGARACGRWRCGPVCRAGALVSWVAAWMGRVR